MQYNTLSFSPTLRAAASRRPAIGPCSLQLASTQLFSAHYRDVDISAFYMLPPLLTYYHGHEISPRTATTYASCYSNLIDEKLTSYADIIRARHDSRHTRTLSFFLAHAATASHYDYFLAIFL